MGGILFITDIFMVLFRSCSSEREGCPIIASDQAAGEAPPDELEASPAGSRSDDYVLAFLWLSFPFSAPTAQTLNYFGLLLLQQLAWAA